MTKHKAKDSADAAIPPPEPIELAKLAAILSRNTGPKAAMGRAMEFYVEAVCFVRELAENSDAFTAYLSVERSRQLFIMPKLRPKLAEAREDTLELDPQAKSDPAREYLTRLTGGKWTRAQTVFANFRRFYHVAPKAIRDGEPVAVHWAIDRPDNPETVMASWKRKENGRTVCDIPRSTLGWLAGLAKSHRTDKKRSSEIRRKALKKSGNKNLQKNAV